MSANNYLSIRKDHRDGKYGVQELDAESGALIKNWGVYGNLKNACRKAQQVMNEEDIEYGAEFRI